jgi:hypothetical protein
MDAGRKNRREPGGEMADYSFVKDDGGGVHGIWLRDSSQAHNQVLLIMLLTKHGYPTLPVARGTRIVPNRFDGSGGVFVMFGSDPAPGE